MICGAYNYAIPDSIGVMSVTDVPRTGMAAVALAAARSAGVAFAIMRSTFLAVKVPITVGQLLASPATWMSILTASC